MRGMGWECGCEGISIENPENRGGNAKTCGIRVAMQGIKVETYA